MPKTTRLMVSRQTPLRGFLRDLKSAPGKWQFAQAIRTILNTQAGTVEQLRLVSDPGYQYTAAEITRVSCHEGRWQLSATLPGLTGIRGVLPFGYQDYAHRLMMGEDNQGLQDFYDIFNQSVLWNSYRTLTRYHLCCRYEEGLSAKSGNQRSQDSQSLGEQLCALAGIIRHDTIPADHLVRYVGVLGQQTRSLSLFRQILTDYLELNIEIKAAPLQRHKLDHDCQTSLASQRTATNTLGSGALLGKSTWLPANKIELTIVPVSRADKERIENDSTLLKTLNDIGRLYFSQQVAMDISLQCTEEMMPLPILSDNRLESPRLGHTHRLGRRRSNKPVTITLA